MSRNVLVFAFLISAYLVLSAWCLDVENKVDRTSSSGNGALDKRDLKGDATVAKFLDPAPEYYRGPGSSSSYGSERDRIRDRDGLVLGLQRPPYGGSGSGYDSRFSPTRSPSYGPTTSSNRFGYQDRIGYAGPSSHGSSGYGNSYSSSRNPYGQPIPIDFPGSSGYGGGSQSYWKNKPYPSDDYIFPPLPPPASDYYTSQYYPDKSALTKSILLPLVGGAILGITAALVANPALLHLGTLVGKRRRRETSAATEEEEDQQKKEENGQKLAYRAYHGKLVGKLF